MKELVDKIEVLQGKILGLKTRVDLKSKQGDLQSLEGEMNQPAFWADQNRARFISQSVANIKNEMQSWQEITKSIEDLRSLAKEDDADDSVNLNEEIEKQLAILEEKFRQMEITLVLSGKYDSSNAVLNIYAGAGGVDAQDWADMLLRMYLRFFENKKWQAKIIDESRGVEGGLKSVALEVKGFMAYGYLKPESGVHRLVRLSPFDADHARHTSFAMVEVIPELETEVDFKIKDEDLRIDVFRASGHGGQSVNTTDSAVRIVHTPTGIKVSCQNERSQKQNKETALKVLKGKLARYYETQVEEERMRLRGELTEAAWGNQIRSYVLHPYKLVKDHRTDYEEHDPEKVLNGELDGFIDQYLRSQIK